LGLNTVDDDLTVCMEFQMWIGAIQGTRGVLYKKNDAQDLVGRVSMVVVVTYW
jgi:hypothetical protein